MEYTFENWGNEKFEYSTSTKNKIPLKELNRIEAKQKEIFTSLWKDKYEEYIHLFESNIANSEEPELCFTNEWNYINSFLSENDRSNLLTGFTNVLHLNIPDEDRKAINKIISEQIIGGKIDFSNITSPNKLIYKSVRSEIAFEYKLTNQIFAFVFYRYKKYLTIWKGINLKQHDKIKKSKKNIPIWTIEHKTILKRLYNILITKQFISDIKFEFFEKHFLGEQIETLIHWEFSIPELVYLFDNLNKKYFHPQAMSSEKIQQSIISTHFSYTDNQNRIISIRANDIAKIRSRGNEPKNKRTLDNIICSI